MVTRKALQLLLNCQHAFGREGTWTSRLGSTMDSSDGIFKIQRQLFARSERVKGIDFHPAEPWILTTLYSGRPSSEVYGNSLLTHLSFKVMSTYGHMRPRQSSRPSSSLMYLFEPVDSLRARIGLSVALMISSYVSTTTTLPRR